MSLKLSLGLRNFLAAGGSVKEAFEDPTFKINLYDGTPPASANDALAGNTLIGTLSASGGATGLTFAAAAVNGAIPKNAGETWQEDSIIASGSPSFYRMYVTGEDPSTANTALHRIQGSVAGAGADLNVGGSGALVATNTFTLGAFEIRVPAG